MERFFSSLTDIRKALVLSGLLHLLLFLIFLLVSVGIDLNTVEFAEMSFVSSSRGSSTAPTIRTERPAVVESKPVAAKSEVVKIDQPKAEPINLPKRRMLEEEKPETIHRESGKLTPNMQAEKIPLRRDALAEDEPVATTPGGIAGEKAQVGAGEVPLGDKELAPTGEVGTATEALPYSIEGDAAQRRILNQVIPQYPAGLQREAVVRIRFTVLPDGRVGQMIPVQKGDPTLDEITIQALRKWRFSPLAPTAEQKNVQGIITFRYELR